MSLDAIQKQLIEFGRQYPAVSGINKEGDVYSLNLAAGNNNGAKILQEFQENFPGTSFKIRGEQVNSELQSATASTLGLENSKGQSPA